MSELAEHFRTLGHHDARTYINSGNVIFSARSRSPHKLATAVEMGLSPLLGFTSDVFIRTAGEVEAVAAKALQLRSQLPESSEVNVAFLREPLSQAQSDDLALLRTSQDDFVHEGMQVYWLYWAGKWRASSPMPFWIVGCVSEPHFVGSTCFKALLPGCAGEV